MSHIIYRLFKSEKRFDFFIAAVAVIYWDLWSD